MFKHFSFAVWYDVTFLNIVSSASRSTDGQIWQECECREWTVPSAFHALWLQLRLSIHRLVNLSSLDVLKLLLQVILFI